MNGYPEWTPASEKPKACGKYLVCMADGDIDYCWFREGNGFGPYASHITAWMPLPPAYEPPRFGWHNAEDELPKRDGVYLVKWAKSTTNGNSAVVDILHFSGGAWAIAVRVLYWSHIEPTPE